MTKRSFKVIKKTHHLIGPWVPRCEVHES